MHVEPSEEIVDKVHVGVQHPLRQVHVVRKAQLALGDVRRVPGYAVPCLGGGGVDRGGGMETVRGKTVLRGIWREEAIR